MRGMKKVWKYLYLQVKRVGKALPAVVLSTLLLTGILSAVFLLLMEKEQKSRDIRTIKIGVTGATNDPYFMGAMFLLQELDMEQFSLELEVMTTEEAKELLRQGKLTGYAVIPDGFVDSVISGENKVIEYVSLSGQASIGTVLSKEVLSVVSGLVVESQSGIYAMHNVYHHYGLDDVLWEDEEELNIRYITYILQNQLFERVQLETESSLSMVNYYICGIGLFFLLVWGISCSSYFSNKNSALHRILAVKGVPAWAQTMGEYAGYLLLMAGSLLVILLLLFTGFTIAGSAAEKWMPFEKGQMTVLLTGCIPVLILVSAWEYLLYELVNGFLNGILVQFFSAVFTGYVSGCFFPRQNLPESMRRLSEYLPTGRAMTRLCSLMSENHNWGEVCILIVYSVCLLLAAAGIRQLRIKHGRESL